MQNKAFAAERKKPRPLKSDVAKRLYYACHKTNSQRANGSMGEYKGKRS